MTVGLMVQPRVRWPSITPCSRQLQADNLMGDLKEDDESDEKDDAKGEGADALLGAGAAGAGAKQAKASRAAALRAALEG